VFLPSVTYSFLTNVIPEGQLSNIQNASTRPMINRLGYAKSTPRAILYGPQSHGGTGLRPLHDEQGSSKVELALIHFRANTMVTTQLHIALAWCQRMSGISHPILEAPSPSPAPKYLGLLKVASIRNTRLVTSEPAWLTK
jgi:hypothetical protein